MRSFLMIISKKLMFSLPHLCKSIRYIRMHHSLFQIISTVRFKNYTWTCFLTGCIDSIKKHWGRKKEVLKKNESIFLKEDLQGLNIGLP